MTFTVLMPWQQSFQGSSANDTVLAFSSNQEIDLGEGDNFLLSLGANTEAKSGNGDDTFVMFGANQTTCQLLNTSVYIADTDAGIRSDIGDTNTSCHPESYCPISLQ